MRKLWTLLKWALGVALVALVALVGVRAYDIQRGPALSVWHTYVPDDLKAGELAGLDWKGYLAREQKLFEDVRAERHRQAAAGRARAGQPLLRRQSDLSGQVQGRLEPLVLQGSGRSGAGCSGAAARPHRFALQPASRGARLSGARLGGHRAASAGPRHRPRGPDRSALGRLVGGDAARHARGAPPRGPVEAAAHRRLLQRRRAGDEVLARRARGQGAAARRSHRADLADDRRHRVRALRRRCRLARGVPGIRQRRVAVGIVPEFNPFKYNSFPINGARQSSLLTRALQSQINDSARAQPHRRAAAGAHLPVGGRLHGQHARHRHRAVRQPARQRQRAGALRREPRSDALAAAALQPRHGARPPAARSAAALSHGDRHQRELAVRRGDRAYHRGRRDGGNDPQSRRRLSAGRSIRCRTSRCRSR